jgi:hypothetical protein
MRQTIAWRIGRQARASARLVSLRNIRRLLTYNGPRPRGRTNSIGASSGPSAFADFTTLVEIS